MTMIHRFDNTSEAISWAANTPIFEQGTMSECMYMLVEGEVTLLHDGDELVTLSAGTMFGEMALLEKRPHYATAIAKTDCKLVAINPKRFQFLVEQTPNFAIEVMTIMAERLDRMNQKATA